MGAILSRGFWSRWARSWPFCSPRSADGWCDCGPAPIHRAEFGTDMTALRVVAGRPHHHAELMSQIVPEPPRQLTENWLKLAVPILPAWAVENMPASRVLFAPVSVAVPTVVQVVPSAE